ncbi:MAG: hypothetical protein IJ447_02270 [Clostridia bacterium]|nr:hypothetical protein [Clostridia bacterium]
MDKFVYKSLRDNDKIKVLKGIIGLFVVISIFMFVITFGMYISESNWDTVTTMPSLFQFETHSFAQTEIYEIVTFYLAIVSLIISIILITILNSGSSCELTVYNEYVEGTAKYNKKIVISLNQINAISVSDTFASISISTAADTYKFLFIKNNQDMCCVLKGDRSAAKNNQINDNYEEQTKVLNENAIFTQSEQFVRKVFSTNVVKLRKKIKINSKKIVATISIIGSIGVLISLFCFWINPCIIQPSIEYSKAKELLESQQYQAAYDLFAKLKNYKDSETYLKSFDFVLFSEEGDNYKKFYNEKGNVIEYHNYSTIYTYEYDSFDRLIAERSGSNMITYEYDSKGNLILEREISNDDGHEWRREYFYDENNNKIKQITSSISSTEEDSYEYKYLYNEKNQLVAEYSMNIQSSFNYINTYAYDINGNCTKKSSYSPADDRGFVISLLKSIDYDDFINSLNKTLGYYKLDWVYNYEYNSSNQIIKATKTVNEKVENIITYEYERDKLVRETNGEHNIKNYIYDNNGNLIEEQNTSEEDIKYTYVPVYRE